MGFLWKNAEFVICRVCGRGRGGLCNVHRVTPTAAAAGGLCDADLIIKITSYKIKVYIHNKNI